MTKIFLKFFSKFKEFTNKDQMIMNLNEKFIPLMLIIEKLIGLYNLDFKKLIFDENEEINSEIIILKNDKDISILNEDEKYIKDNDTLVFISTLHGG
ncbi:MAG: hypothetical protein EAX96_09770 [Candidatus Lokiarchaeota archaeon]|nr:hypothetical protein [Candidatus Lokiarchaeota archaeon]